jgi:gliding motility-associated-like protein
LAITFGAPVITNPSCYGDTNGTAQVLAQNGIGGYSYSWSDGQSSDPATDLAPGTLTVTVTDGNGCTATTTVALVPLTKVEVSITPTNVKCFGANDGSAKAIASGGLAPYGYIWNNHDTTAIIQDLVIGTYAVTATDNNGCTASADTSIGQPTPVVEDLTSIRTSCPASADGEIMDSASGGTGTFTYTLDSNGAVVQTGNTTGTFTGLPYGTYTVVATDQNGCPVSAPISVPQAPFNYYTDTAISTTCYGVQYTDGIIHLQGYQIPNGPFQYSVDGGTLQYIPDFFNLSAGSHTVLAQDNYGCDTTFTVVVPSPPASTLQILPGDSTIAPGDTVQLSTVFTGYSIDSIKAYSWSPATGLSCIDCASPVASPYAEQNTYTLIVTYNQGCVDTASININVNGKTPVYIPNAFTPNGDGVNDVWMVFGTGIKDIKVLVFDRWGEKVFESNDQSIGWDGSYRGQLETPGVYPYVVQIVYLSGESESRQGSLTLIR